MTTATRWFDLYGESHKNPINKLIHWLCIPAIVVSLLGLLQAIPHPFGEQVYLHWGSIVAALTLFFYFRLSWTIGIGMAGVASFALGVNAAIAAAALPLVTISLSVFVIAWVFQFIGHKIEGKKPSFFQDLQFLLVGPAWLLQFVYRRTGVPVETGGVAGAEG